MICAAFSKHGPLLPARTWAACRMLPWILLLAGCGGRTGTPPNRGAVAEAPAVTFADITGKAGLRFQHNNGAVGKKWLPETMGSGCAFLDYDNDGWQDILLINGEPWDARGKHTRMALYHNNHDGTFTDVAAKAGVALGNWSTGATWGDYDGDGKLDLFVPGYVHYDLKAQPSDSDGLPLAFCSYRGVRTYCGPRGLPGETDHLFHNNGDGTFTDVSEKSGVSDKPGYYGLSSVFVDVNNDGKPDLLVGNDSTPNYLYINKGDGTFEDQSYPSGYALDKEGRETASMGIAVGDYRNNGLLDIFNTTFSDDYKVLYRNDGDANFTDVSDETHIADLTIPFLGWGTAFLDYDNDGWKDLLEVNGHVYRNADTNNWGTSWAERPLLFHNTDGKRLAPVPAVEGTALAEVMASRGMAVGDLFNDGRMDAVVNNMDSIPALFSDVDPNHNHWVAFHLVGGPRSPRDATGAALYLTANGMRQRADIFSGGSFASTSDMRPHFGLGSATKADFLEVHWPSGIVEQFPVSSIDRIVTITEGQGKPAAVAKP